MKKKSVLRPLILSLVLFCNIAHMNTCSAAYFRLQKAEQTLCDSSAQYNENNPIVKKEAGNHISFFKKVSLGWHLYRHHYSPWRDRGENNTPGIISLILAGLSIGLTIASWSVFIASPGSYLALFCLAFLSGIAAIILGAIGIRIDKNVGFAIGGLVAGILTTICCGAVILLIAAIAAL